MSDLVATKHDHPMMDKPPTPLPGSDVPDSDYLTNAAVVPPPVESVRHTLIRNPDVDPIDFRHIHDAPVLPPAPKDSTPVYPYRAQPTFIPIGG